MKILIACEESQTVTKEFRAAGHEAYSADIKPCGGGKPEWHIQGDVLPIINGRCTFRTEDGADHAIEGRWELLIAHPPCTFLTTAGNRKLSERMNSPDKIRERKAEIKKAAEFFMKFVYADCEKIAIENPQGFMSKLYRKPDQTIHPYMFAADEADIENYQMKRTCLWLKNLPPLITNNLKPPKPNYTYFAKNGREKAVYFTESHGVINGEKWERDSAAARSKTFPGIAKAMAEQWGKPEYYGQQSLFY